MGIVIDAMTHAIAAASAGRPAPRSFGAQVRAIAGRGPAAAQRLAQRFGVTRRTAQGWLKGGTPNKANRAKVQRETDERAERRELARARRAADANGVRVETRARFGYIAPIGSSDDGRTRLITASIPADLTNAMFDAYSADDEQALREAIAEGIGRDYFRDGGSRASGLNVKFTDIDYLDMEF